MKIECEIVHTNKRLKQLVKEYGDTWNAVTPIQNLQCFNNRLGVGVESLDGKHKRWVEYPSQIRFK